jgi:gamma-glutamylcyclotransferase (GGCT)/AIG2-like uncharacterized protein YtfP
MTVKEFKTSYPINLKPLFVYGTLMTGFGNWKAYLAPVEGVPASLQGFKMFSLGAFPAIAHYQNFGTPETPNTRPSFVYGELFLVDPETLEKLDRLEGHPNFYKRTGVSVRLDNGNVNQRPFSAQTYRIDYNKIRDHVPVIGGCWREFLSLGEDEE